MIAEHGAVEGWGVLEQAIELARSGEAFVLATVVWREAPTSGQQGSIYPFAWNILLGARNEGLGGAMTTLLSASEPEAKEFLGLEDWEAVCGLLPLGKPTKQLTKLSRKPVEEFVVRERGDGEAFTL